MENPTLTTVGILTTLAACFPGFSLTPETTEVYARLLADIPPAELNAGAMQCATTQRFFPAVSELRGAVADLRRRKSGVPSAAEAWAEVCRAGNGTRNELVDENGAWVILKYRYQWSHPLVERVARLLGWPDHFPASDIESVDRAHFTRAYDQAVSDAVKTETLPPALRLGGTTLSDAINRLEARNV